MLCKTYTIKKHRKVASMPCIMCLKASKIVTSPLSITKQQMTVASSQQNEIDTWKLPWMVKHSCS